MSTSHDDNRPSTDAAGDTPAEAAEANAETADEPTGDTAGDGRGAGATAKDAGDGTASAEGAKGGDASEDFLMGTPLPPASTLGGVFSAETFAVVGLLLLAPVIINSRLFEFFAWFVLGGAVSAPASSGSEITVAGGLSALAVLSGAVSLFRSGAHTRASARWVAAATVLVGALFLLLAVTTYAWVPEPSAEFGWFGYEPYSLNG
ncbi:hypothetical protein KIK06_13325 [Nocardiopsis sp. EMB25]|uniref:hypothetical protein n=1 Tax=Nocardiopsis sp. EMB25 TaxID=2835867 RepID=UPI002283B203|nr:hypothetical protein [Nocardiopsis sp. EMB25]MCY9784872.1 hypothetical protein [Nocardiopsis sp. EMB25]